MARIGGTAEPITPDLSWPKLLTGNKGVKTNA